MDHINPTRLKISESAPTLPSCFNANAPDKEKTYKQAIDERVSALFQEHLFWIVTFAVVFSPVFFIALPLGYIALRDTAKDQVDYALAYSKMQFLENAISSAPEETESSENSGEETAAQKNKQTTTDKINSFIKNPLNECDKYFTKAEQGRLISMASALENNKARIYQEGKTTTEIWNNLVEVEKPYEHRLKFEFRNTVNQDYLNILDEEIHRALNDEETLNMDYAELQTHNWSKEFPTPLQAILREKDRIPAYIIERSNGENITQQETVFNGEDADNQNERLKKFADHCKELFGVTNEIGSNKPQKLNSLIMLSMTGNYISRVLGSIVTTLASINNIKDENGYKIQFLIDTASTKFNNNYKYDSNAGLFTITINLKSRIKQTGSFKPVNATVKQTSELVIDLNKPELTPQWKTVSLSIE